MVYKMEKSKQLHVRLNEETHRYLHVLCKLEGIPAQEVMEGLVKEYLNKNEEKLRLLKRASEEKK
jgi:hypothetical protein